MRGVKVLDHRLAVNGVDAPVGVRQRVGVRDHIYVRERAEVDVGEVPAAPRPAADGQADGVAGLPGEHSGAGINGRLRPIVADLRLAPEINQPAQNPQRQRAARGGLVFGVLSGHARAAASV